MSRNNDDEAHENRPQTQSLTDHARSQSSKYGYFTLNDLGEYEELYDPFGDTFTSDDEAIKQDLSDLGETDDEDSEYELEEIIDQTIALSTKLGHTPSLDELSTELGLPVKLIKLLIPFATSPESLDDDPLQNLIQRELTEQMDLQERTHEVLRTLTLREEKVLRMLFGIGEKRDHTLEEIAHDFDVTREDIRQIVASALRKLRHPTRARILKPFVDS